MATKTYPGVRHLLPSRRFPNGGWEVRYRDEDNATLRKTFETREDALDWQAKVRSGKREGSFVSPRKAATTFATVVRDWLDNPEHEWEPKTRAGYEGIIERHLEPSILWNRSIGSITVPVLRKFRESLKETGLSSTTQRNIFRTLNPIFKQALIDRRITENPVPLVKLPRANRVEMKFLTKVQVDELAEEIGPEYRTLVYTAAYTGARQGELAALQVKHLKFLRNEMTIERSVSDVNGRYTTDGTRRHYGPPKNKDPRTFNLPPFLKEMLAAHLAARPHDDRESLVFTSAEGGPLHVGNFMRRHFRPAVKRLVESGQWPADLASLRFHDLRHTCASFLISAGVQVKAIQEQLGHKSAMVTLDIYSHLFPKDKEKVASVLDQIATGKIEVG